MGQEFGQMKEWDYKTELDWMLLQYPAHQQLLEFSKALNRFYLNTSALWQNDDSWGGFSWISNDDYRQSVIAFRRIDDSGNEIVAVCNFVPVQREEYRIGVPYAGTYRLVMDSDAAEFGGSGAALTSVRTKKLPMHGFDQSVALTLPPLSVQYYRCTPRKKRASAVKEAESKKTEKQSAAGKKAK